MKSCLIVDDSKVVRMVARKILEGLSFDIDEAEDGRKGIEACQRHMPDAVLLDWHMPGMTGLEVLHELRALRDGHPPRVAFCTKIGREAWREGGGSYSDV